MFYAEIIVSIKSASIWPWNLLRREKAKNLVDIRKKKSPDFTYIPKIYPIIPKIPNIHTEIDVIKRYIRS